MNNKNILETERLWLRPFKEEDIDDFYECCRNPQLGNNAGWKPHESKEESLYILQTVFIGQKDIWAMINKKNNKVIGSIGIIPDPKRANPQARMLGYWLKEEFWGNGFTSEATRSILEYGFKVLHLQLISAYCYPDNQRSWHLLEKIGFLYEGIFHQAEINEKGEILDHKCYYLTL